jgi:hypothetical protein
MPLSAYCYLSSTLKKHIYKLDLVKLVALTGLAPLVSSERMFKSLLRTWCDPGRWPFLQIKQQYSSFAVTFGIDSCWFVDNF